MSCRFVRGQIDMNDIDKIREVKTIKERLLVYVVGIQINHQYTRNIRKRGQKCDNIRRFFKVIIN
jgi:hypothetical protein